MPYAFWHLPLPDLPPGYPVFLDINLSQEGAQTWLSWLQEGLLLDANTRGMQVTGQLLACRIATWQLATICQTKRMVGINTSSNNLVLPLVTTVKHRVVCAGPPDHLQQ